MLRFCARSAFSASTLSWLSRPSSCCTSLSNPGAARTNMAATKAPARTVANMTSRCRAIFHAPMRFSASVHDRGIRAARVLHHGSLAVVMHLLDAVHAAIGLGEQLFGVGSVLHEKRVSDTGGQDVLAADRASRRDRHVVNADRLLLGGI